MLKSSDNYTMGIWPALARIERQGYAEVYCHAHYAISGAGESMASSEQPFPMRSLFKPWQWAATAGQIQAPHQLIPLASHSGLPMHLEAIDRLVQEWGVAIDDLICAPTLPMDAQECFRLKQTGAEPSRRYHPCVGKHLAVVAACQRKGWDRQSYGSIDHPYFVALQRLLEPLVGGDLLWINDSCGLACPVLTLADQAQLWRRWSSDSQQRTVIDLWAQSPDLMGGPQRLDSLLCRQSGGAFLAKEGADGLLVICERATSQSLVVKVAAGYMPLHLAMAAWAAISSGQDGLLSAPWHHQLTPLLKDWILSQLSGDQRLVQCQ